MGGVLPVTEAQFQAQIIDLARLKGWRIHHCRPAVLPSGKWATHISGDPGFCDLVLARAGRVIFVEVKSEKAPKKLPPNQQAWADALTSDLPGVDGQEHYVWRPSDFPSILKILE
jgi:hypothetical protein